MKGREMGMYAIAAIMLSGITITIGTLWAATKIRDAILGSLDDIDDIDWMQ